MVRIDLGVHTGQQDIELDELRRLWRYADGNGFDWISVWDHFYEAPPRDGTAHTYEAVALMAALAVETVNVRIGTLVFCMTYRNPALLAKSLTTIDHLSHGRLTVGLGAGWHVPEHEGFGYEFPGVKERLDRLSEGTRLIRAMLTAERSTFTGRYYHTADAGNYPPPVQARVPIIIGGRGEQRTLRMAAAYADGWNVPYISAAEYAKKSRVLDEWCEHYERDPASIHRSVNLHFAMSSRGEADTSRLGPGALEGSVHGNPREAAERMTEYVERGAQQINIAIRPPVDWDALASYVAEVMPAFR
jgi:F420-dependent oxidoreductase-like protein